LDASIIIPTYNKLSYLRNALASLESLTDPPDSYEVLVVNDGSTDATSSYLNGTHFNFQLRVVEHDSRQGRAKARNTGIAAAKGKVIVFLDDDMRVVPQFLTAHFHRHVAGAEWVVLGNVQHAQEIRPTALVRYLDTRGVHKLRTGQAIPFRYFRTGNASVPRDLLFRAGLFDERFQHWGGEDLELGYRLERAGAEFHYSPEALSYQYDYKDIEKLCAFTKIYGEYSLPLIINKHRQLRKLFRIDLLDPLNLRSRTLWSILRILLFRSVLWKPCGELIKKMTKVCNRWFVPPIVFDYLILYNYLQGFKKYLARNF
jgi:glycosyltransferase involved in cell wall biosynthesis